MTKIPGYGKIPQFGSKEFPKHFLKTHLVEIEEKLDGSQFSFRKDEHGKVFAKSKKTHFTVNDELLATTSPNSLFYGALSHLNKIRDRIPKGYLFRGEVLKAPRHNVLEYGRAPEGNIVLFDVQPEGEWNMRSVAVKHFAELLGVEAAPLLGYSVPACPMDVETLKKLVEGDSILGGKREGVVLKCRAVKVQDGYAKCKIVAESFRERKSDGSRGKRAKVLRASPIESIVAALTTDARYRKAYQSVRETLNVDRLEPKDIGPGMKALALDINLEEQDWIKEQLWQAHRNTIVKKVSADWPDYVKTGAYHGE